MLDLTDQPATSAPGATETVVLFMRRGEDRRLLEDWLSGWYDVLAIEDPDDLERAFDLCLVDERSFGAHTEALAARKRRADPTFLPYLLIVENRTPATLDQRVWKHVDELIVAPVQKAELRGRLSGLLARRRLSLSLAGEKERVQQLLRSMPDPLVVLDPDGTVCDVNPAFERETGTVAVDVVGADLSSIDAFPAEAVNTLLDAAAVRGSPDEVPLDDQPTVTYTRTDGVLRTAAVGVAKLSPGDGPGGPDTLFLLRDVTERVEREAELEHERERLTGFADALAHEVRNPLNIAQGHVQRIEPADEREQDALETVERAHRRMSQMISELLASARGDSIGPTQTIELARLARMAWDQTPTEDATLTADTHVVVEADPSALQTMLTNLFRNAVEHGTPTGGPRVGEPSEDGDAGPISVRVDGFDGGFYVADDGPGIPEEDRERVFERGYTTSGAGTGLGLALVRQFADQHGWTVTVTEGADGGARFEFRTGEPPEE